MLSKNKQKEKELIYKRVRAFYKVGMWSLAEIAEIEKKSRQWVWLVVKGKIPKKHTVDK